MTGSAIIRVLLTTIALFALPQITWAQSAASPWPAGDELGMANTLGPATWKRCAPYLANTKSKSYELSHLRSNSMPQSPFGTPLVDKYRPTVGIPGTMHAFNGEETVSGEPGAQGTQMDAIGHFAVLPEKWDGKSPFPADKAKYYGGFTQQEVKPTPGLAAKEARHGKSAADRHHRRAARRQGLSRQGQGHAAGRARNRERHRGNAKGAGLGKRGLQAGDVLYIYTGWGDNWKDPDTEKFYYTKGPGLAYDAAKYIEGKKVVLVALDNPFTDPVADGFLQGKAAPPEGTPDGLPFAIHHYNLAHSGIHQIQNARSANLPRTRSGCRAQ